MTGLIRMKIAFRNVFRHRVRSLVTLAAIAMGGVAIIFAEGYIQDAYRKIRESEIYSRVGHLQVYRKGFSKGARSGGFDYLIEDPDRVTDLITAQPGVASVVPQVQFRGMISTDQTTESFVGEGTEVVSPFSTYRILSGNDLPADDPYAVLIGKGLAAKLGVTAGDYAVLLANTVGGSVNALDVKIAGVYSTGINEVDDFILRLPIGTAKDLLRTGGVDRLIVFLDETDETNAAKGRLEEAFQRKGMDLEIKTWFELSDFYRANEAFYKRIFFVMRIILGLIIVFSVYNTMNMVIMERTREIGTVMAMGSSRRTVLLQYLLEGGFLGLVGGLLGSVAGLFVTGVIGAIGIPFPPAPGYSVGWISEPRVELSILPFVLVFSVLVSVVSAFLPARRASKIEIAEALRRFN